MTSLILQNNERFYSLTRLVVMVALTPFFCHRGKAFVKSSNRSRTKQQQFGVNHFQESHSSDVPTDKASEREFHFSCGFFQTDVLVYQN